MDVTLAVQHLPPGGTIVELKCHSCQFVAVRFEGAAQYALGGSNNHYSEGLAAVELSEEEAPAAEDNAATPM